MARTSLNDKMKTGKSIIGVMAQDLVDPALILVLEKCGYDFVVVDQEHGPASFKDVQDMAIVANKLDIALLVRPSMIARDAMSRLLDMGVDGLMVPHVDTPEQAREIIGATRYPPLGDRSFGMRRALLWDPKQDGVPGSAADYIVEANENVSVFIQIETPDAATAIDAILDGANGQVNGIIMGPADFTMNMGRIGEYTSQAFTDHATRVMEACKSRGLHFGIHLGDETLVLQWKRRGMNILMHGNVKGLIERAGVDIVHKLRHNDEDRGVNTNGGPY